MRAKIPIFFFVQILATSLLPANSHSISPEPDSTPAFLAAVSDLDQKIPLYWFKPGIEPAEQTYDDGSKDHQLYVSEEWHQNCMAERFVSPSSPFVLFKSKVFISYQGKAGDVNYSPTDSFFITINRDNHGNPGEVISEPVYTSASGSGTSGGEWVEIEHKLLITEEDTFWIIFHWLEDKPTSPLIGADNSPSHGKSFMGFKKDGYWQWKQLNYNLMIRCLTLSNDSSTSIIPDGYNLYRGDSANFPPSSEFLLINFPADSSHYLDSDVTNGNTYFYKLTALYSGQESNSSNIASATPRFGAILETDVDSLAILLTTGEMKVEYLHLNNSGDLPLDYLIQLELVLDDSTKGTDLYGYTWSDNFTQTSMRYDWVDITQRGMKLNNSEDDDTVYGPVIINFPFPFYGENYDSLWIYTNGVLSFYRWDLRFVNQLLPYTKGYFKLVAPFWSNLVLTDNSKIYLFNSSDSLIITFEDIKHFKHGGLYTFQVIMSVAGTIDFQYKKLDQYNDEATTGIQNQDGTCALLISYNQDYIRDSLRVRINPPWLFYAPQNGEIQPGENQIVKILFDSKFLSLGYYQGNLKISSVDKNHPLKTVFIPVTLQVDTTTSVVDEAAQIPFTFKLGQNYPNPFNLNTIIPFSIKNKGSAFNQPLLTVLTIYNILGQKVRGLLDEEIVPGDHQIIWDGRDDKGKESCSGIYLYQLKVGNLKETRKMLLLK